MDLWQFTRNRVHRFVSFVEPQICTERDLFVLSLPICTIDMNQYGAWLGRDGKAPPFPRYRQMSAGQVAKLQQPSAAYMSGFRKDYDSYFKGILACCTPQPRPSRMP